MSDFTSDYEIRMATLAKLGGDTGQTFDSTYSIDLAILEATGGGGSGATYTAGTGITIDAENKISVDPAVVQNKLTAGSGITIESDEISVDTSVIQPKLTAGEGIEIEDNTISCTVSGGAAIEDVDVLPDPAENKDKIVRLSTDGKLYYVDEVKAIKFTAMADNSSVGLSTLSTNQTLEYFANGSWSNMTTSTNITLNSGDSVYVRGILSGNNSSSNYTGFKGSGSLKVSGNINTIWDYTAEDLGAGFQLKDYCGYHLFYPCSSALIDISELILPATTLANNCYNYMFYGCNNITTSPILPAQTLVSNCYRDMFNSCSNLNKITCLATSIGSLSTNAWVNNVAATGTFYKNPEMSSWTTGSNGIPNGWTVEDYTGSTPEIAYDLVWLEFVTPTLKAGTNILIEGNKINALGYVYNPSTNSIRLGSGPAINNFDSLEFKGRAGSNGCVAIGEGTNTKNVYETAIGRQNVSHQSYDADKATRFSVGNGDGTGLGAKNALEVMQNGDIYAYGVGGYAGTNTKAQDATIKTLQEAIPVVWHGTQAEYDAIVTKDPNTIYLIEEE